MPHRRGSEVRCGRGCGGGFPPVSALVTRLLAVLNVPGSYGDGRVTNLAQVRECCDLIDPEPQGRTLQSRPLPPEPGAFACGGPFLAGSGGSVEGTGACQAAGERASREHSGESAGSSWPAGVRALGAVEGWSRGATLSYGLKSIPAVAGESRRGEGATRGKAGRALRKLLQKTLNHDAGFGA